MVEIFLYFLLAVISGILVGLLPGINIWTPLLIMFPFINVLPVWSIVVIWLGSLIGSQYFGSVAALLYRIPGESSTLIYFKDISGLTRNERLLLIRATAIGSLAASMVALVVLILINDYAIEIIKQASSSLVKSIAYAILLSLIISTEKNKTVAAFLMLIGIAVAPKTDQTLPQLFYTIEQWGYYITPVCVITGVMVIPELLNRNTVVEEKIKTFSSTVSLSLTHYFSIIRGTIIGLVGGLIPGQNASASGLLAYQAEDKVNKNPVNKIIAAESADNSAVITGLLPLTTLGLPITLSGMLFVSLLASKLFLLPVDINKPMLAGLTLIDIIFYTGISLSIVYYFLSQHFLDLYSRLLNISTTYQSIIGAVVVVGTIASDLSNIVISAEYFMWLGIFTAIGIALNRGKVSPVPFLFGYFLGNEIFWSFGYFVRLYS